MRKVSNQVNQATSEPMGENPCARKGNVFNPQCPSREILDLIANKWSALLIHVLEQGTHRHGELLRTVNGISQKMLTQTLRELERNGLVARVTYPIVPPMVEYSLTPLGQSLAVVVKPLAQWAETNLREIVSARTRYSEAPAHWQSTTAWTGRRQGNARTA